MDQRSFFRVAILFEFGLAVLAVVLAWVVGVRLLEYLRFEWSGLFWGLGGTLPLLLLFAFTYRSPLRALSRIKQLLLETLGPHLAACSWRGLLLLAGLAGLSEELLFRGVLQPWLESAWGPATGLIASNVLFGLAHAVTPTYALLAGLVGLYLGILLDITGQRNLLIPIIIHAAYDFIAFIVVARASRVALPPHLEA